MDRYKGELVERIGATTSSPMSGSEQRGMCIIHGKLLTGKSRTAPDGAGMKRSALMSGACTSGGVPDASS